MFLFRFLHKELKQWRQKVLDMFNAQILPTDDIVELATPEDYVNKVTSPPQPSDPEHSIIDQLVFLSIYSARRID